MSRLFVLFALFASFSFGTAHAADAGIAVVDFNRAVTETAEGKAALQRLQTMAQGKQAEIAQKEAEITTLQQEYESKAAVLSETARRDYETRLQEAYAEYQQMGMMLTQEMQSAEMQVMATLEAKLMAVTEEVAKSKGYSLVLRSEVVVFSNKPDITDEVVKRFDTGS